MRFDGCDYLPLSTLLDFVRSDCFNKYVDATLQAVLLSWSFDPVLIVSLLLTSLVYARGWHVLRRRGSTHHGPRQLAAFLAGLAFIFLALASPLDPFGALLLQVHMVQHLLLMVVAPPLIWLGNPALPLLRGLPAVVRRDALGPFLRWRLLHGIWDWLTRPVTAWVLFVLATWVWHVPDLYDATLRSDALHYLEHVCFLGTGLLFWFPVVQPFPTQPRWSRWIMLPYLVLADVQNTAFSALLTFSDRVLYPHYAAVPRMGNLTALDDQAVAGVIMWVPGSLVFLVPVAVIAIRLLSPGLPFRQSQRSELRGQRSEVGSHRIALPLIERQGNQFDLLRLPVLGRFLKWRHARLAVQIPMFLLAGAVILDGLVGPQTEQGSRNLAGVLPWIHWRGLLVLALLAIGNIFCFACPFMLPRRLAKRWLPGNRPPPHWLRGKWLAVVLLILFFWAYEAFSLWASPWWTAWIALGYFLAAFVIDGWFSGATFCKYVCPIGQFNFVQSLVAPLEVRARELDTCKSCTTHDCIRLAPPSKGGERITGCELQLFIPRKAGNMDCTMCLACVHACPHDNVSIGLALPGADLWHDRHRSGVGRFARRPDLAALALVLVFAAFVNAAGMTAPVLTAQDELTRWLGWHNTFTVSACFVGALIVLPIILVSFAAWLGRWWSGDTGSLIETATRFAFALVPVGCGMWLAHYSFHLLTTAGTIVPVVQRCLTDLGLPILGQPDWGCGCCSGKVADNVLRLELVFLNLGMLLSLYTGYRIGGQRFPQTGVAWKASIPWFAIIMALWAVGVWIVFQEMQMRGSAQLLAAQARSLIHGA